jgi:NAD-dependent SIR2 family protein deacetylase
LKAIVQHIVVSARIEPRPLQVPKAAERRSERVATRFSREEMAALEQHARDYGSVRTWLVALARSQIQAGAPQFNTAALEALYESNRELASIGRNVNQIARALNLDLQQVGQLRGSMGLVEELATLKHRIDAHTERVRELCTASASRWNHR